MGAASSTQPYPLIALHSGRTKVVVPPASSYDYHPQQQKRSPVYRRVSTWYNERAYRDRERERGRDRDRSRERGRERGRYAWEEGSLSDGVVGVGRRGRGMGMGMGGRGVGGRRKMGVGVPQGVYFDSRGRFGMGNGRARSAPDLSGGMGMGGPLYYAPGGYGYGNGVAGPGGVGVGYPQPQPQPQAYPYVQQPGQPMYAPMGQHSPPPPPPPPPQQRPPPPRRHRTRTPSPPHAPGVHKIAQGAYAAHPQPSKHRHSNEPPVSTRINRTQPPHAHAGPSAHEWLPSSNPFLDACICTTNCTCRKGARVLYRAEGQGNAEQRTWGEIRYVLKDELGRDCGDHEGCGDRGRGKGGKKGGDGDGEEKEKDKELKRARREMAAMRDEFRQLKMGDGMPLGGGGPSHPMMMNGGHGQGRSPFGGMRAQAAYPGMDMGMLDTMDPRMAAQHGIDPYGMGATGGGGERLRPQSTFPPRNVNATRPDRMPMPPPFDDAISYLDMDGMMDPMAMAMDMHGPPPRPRMMQRRPKPRRKPRAGGPNGPAPLPPHGMDGREFGDPRGPRAGRPPRPGGPGARRGVLPPGLGGDDESLGSAGLGRPRMGGGLFDGMEGEGRGWMDGFPGKSAFSSQSIVTRPQPPSTTFSQARKWHTPPPASFPFP